MIGEFIVKPFSIEKLISVINNCYRYAKAINAKGQPFPAEPVIVALLFSQHKMIKWLQGQISKRKQVF